MFKIVFFVPAEYKAVVKSAVFNAGAGKIGNYDQCCWEVEGVGQFRPLKGSEPYTGELDKIQKVKEYKVELVCEEKYLQQVIVALKQAHPYEEPAYEVVSLVAV